MRSHQQIHVTLTQQCIVKVQHDSIRVSHLLCGSLSFVWLRNNECVYMKYTWVWVWMCVCVCLVAVCTLLFRIFVSVSVSAFLVCSILRNGYFSCLRNSVEESRVLESISTELVFVFKCVEVFIKCIVSNSDKCFIFFIILSINSILCFDFASRQTFYNQFKSRDDIENLLLQLCVCVFWKQFWCTFGLLLLDGSLAWRSQCCYSLFSFTFINY